MKKSIVFKGLIVFAIFGFLSACKGDKKAGSAQTEAASATPVKVLKIARQRISEKLTYTGTLEPWQKINLTPDVGGKVAKIYVEEGQLVQKDQVLAELDTESVRLQLKQAEAGLAVAQANYQNAAKNKERMDRLSKEKAVSDQQVEQVRLGYEAAKAQLEQAQAGLNLARHYLDVSIMKAPWSGVVASKNAQVGDVINPMMGGFSPASGVLTLMDFSRVKVVVDVSENDIVRIKKGQNAFIKVPNSEGRIFQASVTLVNMTADAQAKKFRVEVTADNPGLVLRPGTFGDAGFEVNVRDGVIVLPQKAIIDNKYVFLAQGHKALKKEVTLGLQNADQVEITSGIQEGDLVIIEGNYGLENGSPIEVLPEVTK
jgi:RND family efflux transporter MFP subunit